jgi:SAM-dependent methyltransferase
MKAAPSGLRLFLKAATQNHFWTRYALRSAWRTAYSAASLVTSRNASGSKPEAEINSYAAKIFSHYKSWAGVDRFRGRVSEVGPGDVLTIANMFIADGCSRVDQVDRFFHRNGNSHPGIQLYRQPAEKFFLSHGPYDFIVSCAVMEHLYDPLSAIRAMASALSPKGMMIHVIDCRDHGQFSDSFHDLSFLRIPRVLYRPLTLASGLNRIRLSSYLRLIQELGLKARVLVNHLSGVDEDIDPALPFESLPGDLLARSQANLASIRKKLSRPFREMDDRDLLISCFVLIVEHKS